MVKKINTYAGANKKYKVTSGTLEESGKQEVQTGNLINIAKECTIMVQGEQQSASNMVDRDKGTLWINNNGNWPDEVVFQLPEGLTSKVKKVILHFEQGHASWSVDVALSHALNNVTSDYIVDNYKQDHSLSQEYVYTYDVALNMTHEKFVFSNPKNNGQQGAFRIAIAEVEIWVEDDATPLEAYDNLTKGALITSTKDTLTQRAWIELAYQCNQKMIGFELAFDKPKSTDVIYTYMYNILGKSEKDASWSTIVALATATSKNHIVQQRMKHLRDFNRIRVEVVSITSSDNSAVLPVVREIKIYGEQASAAVDSDSVAWKKKIYSNYANDSAYKINDGDLNTIWSAEQYPAYVDIDLNENYYVSGLEIYTPESGYSQYSVYYSMDGSSFTRLFKKADTKACPSTGDKYNLEKPIEAKYIRLYMEYYSDSEAAALREVRVFGTPSNTAILKAPEISVKNFSEDTAYNQTVFTKEEIIQEVQGMIARNVGDFYVNWFEFEIAENPSGTHYDYYTIFQSSNGKIHIKGNNGVSLATGLNYYFKYYCKVMISQAGSQTTMPKSIVAVPKAVTRETRFPIRYAYNYCTYSYTMAFWGEQEWQKELDWLALNGVNLVLDLNGQEEVWRRFLGKLGYNIQEIKDYIAGPAYYAWAYMANLSGCGGPIHDSWFGERTELARKNQLRMRKLGMQPILQGYSGMVPTDIKEKDASAQMIPQGTWCSLKRPSMLVTSSDTFARYATLYYAAQKEVYGDSSHYYATDPFHEGGDSGGLSATVVAKEVMNSMLAADDKGVWVIQSWQGNPTKDLLAGLEGNREHALVLDLYAEKTPHYNDANAYGGLEFSKTPWVFCMLNNFGGRMGLHGHLDNLANNIADAAKNTTVMAGIGIAPEGAQNNPVLYDFFFETIWSDTPEDLSAIDVKQWLKEYQLRRYGAESDSAKEALNILSDTVYKAEYNGLGQGAPESVINARPALFIGAASTWGNAVIGYDKKKLECAADLLLKDYEKLKGSDAYLYDVADVLKQVLSNTAQEIHKSMSEAYQNKDIEAFNIQSDKFLKCIDMVEKVLSTRKEFLFGTWTTYAQKLAANADDFAQDLYLFNAKALVTTWASKAQCESGGLKDYSNRQWAGLTIDFYKKRWEKWITNSKKELQGEKAETINWFEYEWAFARSETAYSNVADPTISLEQLGKEILMRSSILNNRKL